MSAAYQEFRLFTTLRLVARMSKITLTTKQKLNFYSLVSY